MIQITSTKPPDDVGSSAPPPATTDSAASASVGVANPVSGFLADPVFSGGGTWLGTIISIVAAVVAYRQAKKATAAAVAVKAEQARRHVEHAKQQFERLDQVLNSAIHGTAYKRGSDVGTPASEICHRLLGTPVIGILPDLKQILESLSKSVLTIDAAGAAHDKATKTLKTATQPADIADAQTQFDTTKVALDTLQEQIRSGLQAASLSCSTYLENRETEKL